jgi:hypothetical protein
MVAASDATAMSSSPDRLPSSAAQPATERTPAMMMECRTTELFIEILLNFRAAPERAFLFHRALRTPSAPLAASVPQGV